MCVKKLHFLLDYYFLGSGHSSGLGQREGTWKFQKGSRVGACEGIAEAVIALALAFSFENPVSELPVSSPYLSRDYKSGRKKFLVTIIPSVQKHCIRQKLLSD